MFRRWARFALFGRRHARATMLAICASTLVLAGLTSSAGPAGANAATDQGAITQLEQQIAAQGAQAQSLVSRYDEVQAHLDSLDAEIAHDNRLVAADQRVEATAARGMQTVAVTAYVSGAGSDSSTLSMFSGTWDVSRMLEQDQYLSAANTKLDSELISLHLDQVHTQDAQSGLRSAQGKAKQTLDQLTAAHTAATAAIAADETQLSHVKGDLRSLLAAANARRHEAQEEEERALAQAAQAPAFDAPVHAPSTTLPAGSPPTAPTPPSSPTLPPPASPLPTSSGYANPLRDASALSPERIDQGVDYSAFGPIYAIGDGVVLSTVGSGWPGGTFIAYQLTDGPASGLVVYAAEDIEPSVQVGAAVTSNTVIGQIFEGPDGIETGWADGASLPDTMARTYGQFNGSNSAAFGYNFSQLLQSLGAPGGILEAPLTGALPAAWPSW